MSITTWISKNSTRKVDAKDKGSRKKIILLMPGPLRGGGGLGLNGPAINRRFFSASLRRT